MPTVHNPTDQDLFCHAAGAIVPARGSVAVTVQVAALVPLSVFEVREDPEPVAAVETPVVEPVAAVEPAVDVPAPAAPVAQVLIDPAAEAEILAAAKLIEAEQAASTGA